MNFLCIILICTLILGTLEPEQPQLEIRGVWVESSSLISQAKIDEMLDRMDRGHFNVVNALVFEQGYSFWNSQLTEMSPDIESGFDPLQYLTEEAHKRGIQVHTWLIVGPVGLWDGEKGPVLTNHPEWALQNSCGDTFKNWLDLSQDEVRHFWCDIVSEIVQNYNVDGIHLDYIRYPGKKWGYNSQSLNRYTEAHTDQNLLLKPTLPLYNLFEGNPLAEVTTADVLAEFDNEVPAVVLNQYGQGDVLLFNWYMTPCETQAAQDMVERAFEFLDKEHTYVYYAPETVDIYGWDPFYSIWTWINHMNESYWLEAEWFEPDPDGVVIFPYTYYLNEEAVLKLEKHVKAGGAAIFLDGPVFAMKFPELRKIIGMNAVGDYFWGTYTLNPVKEHDIIPRGEEYSITRVKRVEKGYDQFRKDQVTETVNQIRVCLPSTMLTAAVFDNKQSADYVLQDWYSWMGYLDYAMPMAYVSELEELEEDLNEWERALGLDQILPGLSVMIWWPTEEKKSHEDVLEEIKLCKKRGVKGVILFNLENMDDDFLDALANDLFAPLIRFDYSPPEIKEVQVKKDDTVVISWKTSEPCRFTLHYEQPESEVLGDITNEELKEYHQVVLQDLTPDTVYTVVVLVEDKAGNQNKEEITFKTEPVPDSDVPLPLPEKSKIPKTLIIPFILVMVAFFILKMRK